MCSITVSMVQPTRRLVASSIRYYFIHFSQETNCLCNTRKSSIIVCIHMFLYILFIATCIVRFSFPAGPVPCSSQHPARAWDKHGGLSGWRGCRKFSIILKHLSIFHPTQKACEGIFLHVQCVCAGLLMCIFFYIFNQFKHIIVCEAWDGLLQTGKLYAQIQASRN